MYLPTELNRKKKMYLVLTTYIFLKFSLSIIYSPSEKSIPFDLKGVRIPSWVIILNPEVFKTWPFLLPSSRASPPTVSTIPNGQIAMDSRKWTKWREFFNDCLGPKYEFLSDVKF